MTDISTTIVKAIQTCYALPSAWDAWTDTGARLYLKYRYGKATVWRYSGGDFDELESSVTVGDRRDGLITLEDFCAATGFTLGLREPYTPMPDPNGDIDPTESPAWAEETEPPVRAQVLRVAEKLVCGDREDQYGAPAENLQRIANYWNDYLYDAVGARELLEPRDVALMMILMKVAREVNGHKVDSMVDIAGYAAIGAEAEQS